jgi:outer membrane protein TolC
VGTRHRSASFQSGAGAPHSKSLAALATFLLPLAAVAAEPAGLGLVDSVRTTLALQRDIRIQEEFVETRKGAVVSASAAFDTVGTAQIVQRLTSTPLTLAEQTTIGSAESSITAYPTSYQLGLSRRIRSGISLAPALIVERQSAGPFAPSASRARVAFVVNHPLLRGRGADSTAAQESAALVDVEASVLAVRDVVAQKISATATAYWGYRAAGESLDVRKAAEERAEAFLAQESQLVKAGEHPASELQGLTAALADARTATLDAELRLLESRQAVGIAMGVAQREMSALAPPSDPFAVVRAEAIPDAMALEKLLSLALDRRADRLAAKLAVQSAGILAHAAQRDLEPQLDLLAEAGYAGLAEGSGVAPLVTALGQKISGPNLSAGVIFQYPLDNHAAKGRLSQQQAAERRAVLSLAELERRIQANVSLALLTLRTQAAALKSAEEAVVAHHETIKSTRKKQHAGLSTLFDVLFAEARLTNAELGLIQVKARLSQALVRVRFETGALVEPRGDVVVTGLEQLSTLP